MGDGDITGSNNKFYAGTLSVAPKTCVLICRIYVVLLGILVCT
ncbi:UNVERIFIED_ORG: hypothetical protein [Escherichia phage CMSTMSU]